MGLRSLDFSKNGNNYAMRKSAEQKSIKTKTAKTVSVKGAKIQPAQKIQQAEQLVKQPASQPIAHQPIKQAVKQTAMQPETQTGGAAINGYIDDGLEPIVGALFRAIAGVDERQIVIVCFGTNAISGDSLGPTVGSLLRDKYKVPAFVYGTDGHCVNGKNMGDWIEFIKAVHGDALYIAVDASLGAGEKTGQIILRSDGVCPAAIKGKKARFGDVGILGVVAKNTSDPLMQLMSVSPLYVANMAEKIANMLRCALR